MGKVLGKGLKAIIKTNNTEENDRYLLGQININKISPNENEVSKENNSSWMEVECLGACVNAPMMQINDDYYEDLDEKNTREILESLALDKPLKPGSYRDRKSTRPEKLKRSEDEKYA